MDLERLHCYTASKIPHPFQRTGSYLATIACVQETLFS